MKGMKVGEKDVGGERRANEGQQWLSTGRGCGMGKYMDSRRQVRQYWETANGRRSGRDGETHG